VIEAESTDAGLCNPGLFEAVLFDFGGVITTSPFDGFAAYEARAGLPPGLIRRINSTNPDTNAWARFERSDIGRDEFGSLFEAEAAALGHTLDAREVLACLATTVRPEMLRALERLSGTHKTAILTNNVVPESTSRRGEAAAANASVLGLVDVVVESSRVGRRKPEPRFYEIACEALGVAAAACVFLDDLGINLKPARAMGMTTIKVTSGPQALAELEAVLGVDLT
jgi:putative hydrolase of the HAD superfamily